MGIPSALPYSQPVRPLKQDHDVDALEAVLPVASNLGLPPEEEWADAP